MKKSEIRSIIKEEVFKSKLSELVKDVIGEMEFADQDTFKKYQSQHRVRPDTEITIGGKKVKAGDVGKKRSAKKTNIHKALDKNTMQDSVNSMTNKLEHGNAKQSAKRIVGIVKKYGPVLDKLSQRAEKYNGDNAPQSFRNNVFKLHAMMSAADNVEIESENSDEIYQSVSDNKEKSEDLFRKFF